MGRILALRPFVPARDFALSRRFYEALGFGATAAADGVLILEMEGASFILQDFYVREFAENCMLQLLVRDAEAWWAGVDPAALVAEFAVRPPQPPAMQAWGMKVGFLFDPSGVLWHVAESPP
jgi:hypothetical protein